MDEYRVFTWDKKRFPDPAAMLTKLREQGFRVITIVDPGVKYEPGYKIFDEGMARDVFCKTESCEVYVGQVWPGRTAFPDFAVEDVRKWWGELNAAHVRSGLAGIWNDMNEPATGEVPPDAMRFEHGRQTHRRFHNQYAMLMAMGTTEGLLSEMPDLRTFVLSRAGSAGIQRYAANWMGDNCARWNHLWMSIPMALGFGISGQPFVGADIGGFMENGSPELLVRWYQCGALTPFCRNHNSRDQIDKYPWVFGETVEELCRAALELRYRLMPYIYTSFFRSSETGEPVQSPLIFQYQNDRTLRDLDDQYLFGSDLLVAPIYVKGETARQVYLPQGTWYHWFTGEKFNGRKWVVAQAPMEHIPLYARGGAVIPMWPSAPDSTMDFQPETIELHVFIPDEDVEDLSFLHEDDGRTFAFRRCAFYRTEFLLRRAGAQLTLDAKVTGDGFPEFARRHLRLVFHGGIGKQVEVNGERVLLESGSTLLENAGEAFRVEATLGSAV
jgi:alpha-glucosidase